MLDKRLRVTFMILRTINVSFHKQYYQAGICNVHAGIFCELQLNFLSIIYHNEFKNPTLHFTTDLPNAEG